MVNGTKIFETMLYRVCDYENLFSYLKRKKSSIPSSLLKLDQIPTYSRVHG